MTRTLAGLGAMPAALLALVACRSAFIEEPGVRHSEAPTAQQAAVVTRAAAVRTGPDRGAPVVIELAAGTAVTASDQSTRGFRRVRTSDGRSGYVEDGAVQVGGAAAAPAAQPETPASAPEPGTAAQGGGTAVGQ
jgi:Bacterial SH3 domain